MFSYSVQLLVFRHRKPPPGATKANQRDPEVHEAYTRRYPIYCIAPSYYLSACDRSLHFAKMHLCNLERGLQNLDLQGMYQNRSFSETSSSFCAVRGLSAILFERFKAQFYIARRLVKAKWWLIVSSHLILNGARHKSS